MPQGFGRSPSRSSSSPAKVIKTSILDEINGLDDPRTKRKPLHLLVDIVTIAILATICGADTMEAVETYGNSKHEWLSTFLELPHGIPSHDTFSRVFAQLAPHQFEAFFLKWIEQITTQLSIKLIHIDGKTHRGSRDTQTGLKALHSVSAWASEHHLVLAQQRVDSKSNEITAIPEVLEMLSLEGTIITLDAMGTQTAIAAQIVAGGGDYILALKANQDTLYQGVKHFFEEAIANDWQGIEYDYTSSTESAHHRIEHRQTWVVPIEQVPNLWNREKWTGLTSIVMVRRKRILQNKEEEQIHFYISSMTANATVFAQSIRSHWSIENSLHWVLDVTFKEDNSRIRKGHGPENMGLLRRLCVSVIKQDSTKGSIKIKRYRAALDNNYLLSLLMIDITE